MGFRLKHDLSPLRYPGSKQSLTPYLYKILQHNEIRPSVLIESFVGGGSVFIQFLANQAIKRAIIADKDQLIASFWKVLFAAPERMIKYVKSIDVTIDKYYDYKYIAMNWQCYSETELAEACLFLNRTSFSGIMADPVGPLGGKNQLSPYDIGCRFIKDTLVRRIKYLAAFSKRVTVLSSDWRDTIDFAIRPSNASKRNRNLLFYFDPPFYKKAEDLYREYFTKEEHQSFYKIVTKLDHDWILSYDNCPEIIKMYSNGGCGKMSIEMPYSLNSHAQRREKELIITPLNLPDFSSH